MPAEKDWRHQSACLDADPDLFFPDDDGYMPPEQVEACKQVCAGCPVRDLCLTWALETKQAHGVWGGLGEDERTDHMVRKARKKAAVMRQHQRAKARTMHDEPLPLAVSA